MTVPQALTPEAETKAASMPRACAKVFPTQVKDGLIFAWLQSGPEAYVESSMCVFLPLCVLLLAVGHRLLLQAR
jgi:phenylpropionate dioxygenase-like ring-hydroxylating dioxygenase large terminal subunit